jgi:hypothetical protein
MDVMVHNASFRADHMSASSCLFLAKNIDCGEYGLTRSVTLETSPLIPSVVPENLDSLVDALLLKYKTTLTLKTASDFHPT